MSFTSALRLFGLYGLLYVVGTGGVGGLGLPEFLLGLFWGPIGVELAPVQSGKQWYPPFVSVACRVVSGFAGLWCVVGVVARDSGGRRGPR